MGCRGLGKMLIYTIVVLSLMRGACSRQTRSEYYKEQLIDAVVSYRKFIDPECSIAGGKVITPEVLQSFEYVVHFVLKLMFDFYHWKLPDVENSEDGDNTMEVHRQASIVERNPLEMVACSLVPRLLAFLYFCTDDLTAFFQFHRLHFVLCFVAPVVAAQSSPEKSDRSMFPYDTKTVTLLHDLRRQEFPNAQTSTEAQRNGAAGFVARAFEATNGVDKEWLLTTLRASAGPWRNVFGEATESDFFAPRHRWPNEDKAKELDHNLKMLNERYTIKTPALAGYITEKKNSVAYAVNQSLTYAFKTFVTDFGRIIRCLTDEKFSSGRTVVIQELMDTTAISMCDRVPLLLVYLADNCDAADIAPLFCLYLTLCADWAKFVHVHCPTSDSVAQDRACVTNAISDRLLVNFYWATGDFTDYDDDAASSSCSRQGSDIQLLYKYLINVSMVLANYYANSEDDNMPMWTTSDWLTGKHLLEYHHRGAGHIETIALSKHNHGGAAVVDLKVPLTEAHDLLLSWHLDARNVLAFHAALVDYERRAMDEFVYRHAEIVVLYLDHVPDSADATLAKLLSGTIGWYAECARVFRDYLSLPGPLKPPPARPVDGVVSAIENLKDALLVDKKEAIVVITQAVPAEKRAELLTWAEQQFSGLEEKESVKQLNQMLEINCKKAVDYLDALVEIARKSKVMGEKSRYVRGNCEHFVTNVFVT